MSTKAQGTTAAKKPAAKGAAAPAAPEAKAEAKSTGKAAEGAKPAAKNAAVKAPAPKTPKKGEVMVDGQPMKLSLALDADAKTIDKAISSIKLRGAKFDVDVHSAACAALNHVKLHNDPTLLNRLVNAMPKVGRANAVILWAVKFGNLKLNEGQNKAEMPLAYDKEATADIEGAIAEPFWALKNVREGGGREWLYTDFITGVMKTLARIAADPQHKEAKKAKAALDSLAAVNEGINAHPAPENGAAAPVWTHGMPERRGSRAADGAAKLAETATAH